MTKAKKLLQLCALASVVLLGACKKDKISKTDTKTANGTRTQLTKDSIFLYAKELYLWNQYLPSYEAFAPRDNFNFSEELYSLNRELFAITQKALNPTTGKSYEYNPDDPEDTKYSFIEDLAAKGVIASVKNAQGVDFNGEGNDTGFYVYLEGKKTDYKVYIRFCSPGSPAALAGLGRADRITKINGKTIGSDYDGEVSFLEDALNASNVTLAGINKKGLAFNVSLTAKKYDSSPIFKDSVLTVGAKKIGYLAFARFTSDKNSAQVLDNVFAKFANAGVSDLVIDLRYNPGGYVSTAEHLINLIAPSGLNGRTMFVETYNETLRSGKASILVNQPLRDQEGNIEYKNGKMLNYKDNVSYRPENNTTIFEKEGNLNSVTKVAFITTDNTASASELVINSLKPHITVKTFGSTSYGKPVGFFPIRIDKYDVYLSSFSTKNSEGDGDYYDGIAPDLETPDDVKHDFGDTNESSLAAALAYLTSGSLKVNRTLSTQQTKSENTLNKAIGNQDFKGMIAVPKGRK